MMTASVAGHNRRSMTSDERPPILQAADITKSYAGVHALKAVSFELLPGEVHALIGENGAGKSTLIKVITGAVTPDSGTLTVGGHLVAHNSPAIARALGIAAVYQQPSLFPDLTVAENIALSLESGGIWRTVDWKGRDRLARELLARAGSDIRPDRLVATLSMPEQQIVEIAKAIGARAKVLILDEPTASLTEPEVEALFRIIATLRTEGVGIIYISHRLEEIAAIADRVTVLRDGQSIATRAMREVDRAELIRLMVGREVSAIFPKRAVPLGEVVLETRGLRGVSISVRAGEILGIAGLVGSGRTEFAEAVFGLAPAPGAVFVRGKPVHIGSPADAIRLGIGYVPEDRRQHGVVLEMPIASNTCLANLGAVSRRGMIDSGLERDLARSYVKRLQIKTASLYAEAGSLSGGNQQKVALSRWLAIRPAVLILDEPTQGVDVGSKSEIHRLMVDLAEQGVAIIMISSELPEILGMSDRIAVMHAGSVAGVLAREDATQARILSLALGTEHAA
jgi:rhamnose transport system ATP-binding protein